MSPFVSRQWVSPVSWRAEGAGWRVTANARESVLIRRLMHATVCPAVLPVMGSGSASFIADVLHYTHSPNHHIWSSKPFRSAPPLFSSFPCSGCQWSLVLPPPFRRTHSPADARDGFKERDVSFVRGFCIYSGCDPLFHVRLARSCFGRLAVAGWRASI